MQGLCDRFLSKFAMEGVEKDLLMQLEGKLGER